LFSHNFISHFCDAGQNEGEAVIQLKQIYGFLGYCDRGVAQTGPGTTGARKEEGKKGSGLTMFHLNRYVSSI